MNAPDFRPRFARLLLFGLIAPLLPAAEPAKPAPEETIELPKFSVKGVPVCSYGIAIAGIRDQATRQIKRLFITDVSPDSTAARNGLREGDEIIAINGLKVAGMDGTMKPGSQLFDLINQPEWREIKLEVIVHTTQTMTLKAGH
jgi:C-terminal processing protease CtpA/Prc